MDIDIIYNEDCFETFKRLGENSIDAIVTDPPYGLEFMGKEWDRFGVSKARAKYLKGERHSSKFGNIDKPNSIDGRRLENRGRYMEMTIKEKASFQEFIYQWAAECLRVIKPGGNLLSFGGTRTYHRMVSAIEDAGFEIRDCIMWVYGSGFPKSLNIGKAVDKKLGNKRDKIGKYRHPRSVEQGKEIDNTWGVDSLDNTLENYVTQGNDKRTLAERLILTKGNSEWEGYGTGLKPAYEPIVLAMKPLDGTFAENCLKWEVGGLNIDGCRIGIRTENESGWSKSGSKASENRSMSGANYERPPKDEIGLGRFPANFIHDGSQEVMELFPDTTTGSVKPHKHGGTSLFGMDASHGFYITGSHVGDSGSAARYFYTPKASKRERGENNGHPTVKPLALMEYLVKLVTRPGHIVLDPFIGSGTTAIACVKLGRHYIGCELDKGYYDIAIKRIANL